MKRGYFARVNTRVTRAAWLRLTQECQTRERQEAGRVSMGKVIVEMVMDRLPPHPDELPANGARKRRPPARASQPA